MLQHAITFINWDKAKIIDQEADKTTRWLKEAIWIRNRNRGKETMNKDEGGIQIRQNLWPDNSQKATFEVDDGIRE